MALNRTTRETLQRVGGSIAVSLVSGMISRIEIH